MIPRETIQKIMDAARIEEVVGEFVSLKKTGKNYKGFSPFTNETNPSFYVSPSKNIFKCFSSGKGGNAVTFLMEHERLSYPEALRYLAGKYSIEIEEKEQTPEEIREMNERETLFHVNAFAQKYFSEQLLKTDKGRAIGLSYLKEREFREEAIELFHLGYAPEEWDAFTSHALRHGYKKEYLVKTGLTVEKENNRAYDRFRGRVIFPIHNLSGRILGFGGRILVKDDKKPKYVNSPESEIYNKSRILYGLYFAKNSIIREDLCYLVEGYTDVIALYQSGIQNVVASSGTSLTVEQIRLIKRYTSNITILYDGDEAGIKASFRSIDLILEQGMNVRIVLFPGSEDPDSYVRKHRVADVLEFLDRQSTDFITFKTQLLKKETSTDPVKRGALIREIVETIALIPDVIYRTVYIRECSAILDVPEPALVNEMNRLLRKKHRKKQQKQEQPQEPPEPTEYPAQLQKDLQDGDANFQERDIIRLLLNYGREEIVFRGHDERKKPVDTAVKVANFIIGDLQQDGIEFKNPLYQRIYEEYLSAHHNETIPDQGHFIHSDNDEVRDLAVDLLSSPYELSKNWINKRIFVVTEKERLKYAVETSLLSFKAREVEAEISRNNEKLKEISDESHMLQLLREQKELKDLSRRINKKLSRIITK
ncbi:MAG: DNA primase [Bacteroidales bacterium]